MIRLQRIAFLILLVTSCKPEYKRCNCESKTDELKAYSEILNELVEHRFYNIYLGKDEERIFNDYVEHRADTERIDREVARLQNKIYGDTSRFCTMYLDTSANKLFKAWRYALQKNTNSYGNKIRNLILEVSDNLHAVIDSIGAVQSRLLPKDFRLCTSKIELLSDFKFDSTRCSIGKINLSKIYFNSSRNKGLLYFDFVCGGLCGYGKLIVIEKVNGRWVIKNGITIWIS